MFRVEIHLQAFSPWFEGTWDGGSIVEVSGEDIMAGRVVQDAAVGVEICGRHTKDQAF